MNIEEKIEKIKKELKSEIQLTNNTNDLANLKVKYLGKKGLVTELTRDMSNFSIEEKKEIGRLSNELKKEVNTIISSLEEDLNNKELEKRRLALIAKEKFYKFDPIHERKDFNILKELAIQTGKFTPDDEPVEEFPLDEEFDLELEDTHTPDFTSEEEHKL